MSHYFAIIFVPEDIEKYPLSIYAGVLIKQINFTEKNVSFSSEQMELSIILHSLNTFLPSKSLLFPLMIFFP